MSLRDWEDSADEVHRPRQATSGNTVLIMDGQEVPEDAEFVLSNQVTSSTYDLYKDLGGKAPKLGGTFGRRPSAVEDRIHHEMAMEIAAKKQLMQQKLSLLERVRLYFLGY